jgi:hypothetical protein
LGTRILPELPKPSRRLFVGGVGITQLADNFRKIPEGKGKYRSYGAFSSPQEKEERIKNGVFCALP